MLDMMLLNCMIDQIYECLGSKEKDSAFLFLIISAKYSAIYIEIVKFPLKNATFRKAQKISLFSETL